MIKLAITGAAGRMGRRIVAIAQETGAFEITSALELADNPFMGHDAGELAGIGKIGVPVTEELTTKPDVIIDFTSPASTEAWTHYCADNGIGLVVGTTGLNDDQKALLKKAGEKTRILWGANMSLGVNLLFKLVAEVAKKLPNDYDIEVTEAHHRFKKDAPSGTALELARHMAESKGWPFPDCLQHGREGREALREENTIGMHAIRGGDIVGEHDVIFSALGETITINHRAHSRDTFVRGAVKAAQWLADKQPGMYTMFDVLDV